MTFNVEEILGSVSKVKLKGGVVGKVSIVLIIVALSMAAISWSVQIPWISVLALFFIFILCFVMIWRLISFADKNPQAALLEGAEFLVHEQLRLGSKNERVINVDQSDKTLAEPITDSEEEKANALKPDKPENNRLTSASNEQGE
ncbi:MAG: hypothetical protein KAT04_10035 [Methylococcales bacterium]|nr:hypothetical protein [Methylococcales bacterium]